jgi:type IV pilus assembly protein PilC
MEAGMNFLDVFIFLREIMSNLSYKEAIDDIIGAINRGETIGGTLENYTHFIAKDVVALLKVGEETASFETALTNAIRMYEEEFNKVLDGLSKVIEPVLIVFIGGIIAMVALSVFGIIGSLLDSIQI